MFRALTILCLLIPSICLGFTKKDIKRQKDYIESLGEVQSYGLIPMVDQSCEIETKRFGKKVVYVPKKDGKYPVYQFFNGTFGYPAWYAEGLKKIARACYVVVSDDDSMILWNGLLDPISDKKTMAAIDYTIEEIAPKLHGKADVNKLAVSGHSQGGGAAILSITHPKVKTIIPIQPLMLTPKASNKPMLVFAGQHDVIVNKYLVNLLTYRGYQGPKFYAERQGRLSGHIDWSTSGGYFTKPIVHWMDWHLKGKPEAIKYFTDMHLDEGWVAATNMEEVEPVKLMKMPSLPSPKPLPKGCFDFKDFDANRAGPYKQYKYEKLELDGSTVRVYIPEGVPDHCKKPVVYFSIATNTGCLMYRNNARFMSTYGAIVGCSETKNQQKGKDCVNFIKYAADNYNSDPSRFGTIGHSQGGSSGFECSYTVNNSGLGYVHRAHVGLAPAWGFMGNNLNPNKMWDKTIYNRMGEAPVNQYFLNLTGDKDMLVGFQHEKGFESLSNSPVVDVTIKGESHVGIIKKDTWTIEASTAFMVWRLFGNEEAGSWFKLPCLLCQKKGWSIRKKLID
jgi:predicted esterase